MTITLDPNGPGRAVKAGSYATDLEYAPSGQLTDLGYGNGISGSWGYNTRNLLDTTTYSLGIDPLTNRTLSYDKNGNLKTITDTINGSNCTTGDTIFCNGFELPTYIGAGNRAFDYDDLDRLLEVTNPYVPDVFTYDPLGNLRTTSDLGTFHYDAHNRIDKRTHGTTVFNYVWSTRGTLSTDGERSFTWNRANELTADSQGGSFGYDANGWRIRKARDGTLAYYVYDQAHRLMVRWNNTTQTETDFIHLGGRTIARIAGSQVTYIQPDYHGSPLFETGSNGTITRQPFYLGYGRTTATGRSKIPGYTGAAMDVTTGHTYLGARYLYHKRFTSPDPAALDPTTPTGLNRYAYAADDPVNNFDPNGKDTVVQLQYYIIGNAPIQGDYGHQYVYMRDTNTGEEAISRAGPSAKYPGGSAAVVSRSPVKNPGGHGNVTLVTEMGPANKSADSDSTTGAPLGKPVVNSTITLKEPIGTAQATLGKFNKAVDAAEINYKPLSTNSNAYANTAYQVLTGTSPPSSDILPGSDVNLKSDIPACSNSNVCGDN